MKRKTMEGIGWILLIVTPTLAQMVSCSELEGFSECREIGDTVVFEDNFNSRSLNHVSWTQIEEMPAPYEIIEEGFLKIVGDEEGDGATFVNEVIETGGCYSVLVEFHADLEDPVEDNPDLGLLLNFDSETENGYFLSLTSNPLGESRAYTMTIYRVGENEGELVTVSVPGPGPQLVGNTRYHLAGTYCDGCISFSYTDLEGQFLRKVSIRDSKYPKGGVGFHGDLNTSSSQSQSIYLHHFTVYN